MNPLLRFLTSVLLLGSAGALTGSAAEPPARHTSVTIGLDQFHLNGQPTFKGRTWRGYKIEGLLPNSRMVQGIYDDLNAETRARWAYPDTGKWDADRNTTEFIAAMTEWRRHGLLAFDLNLQGGSPQGYSKGQPWINSALDPAGELRPDYMARLGRILDRADELGMVVMLGVYYFGQDERMQDEAAVKTGLRNAVEWVLDRGYTNVLLEVNNECDKAYDHAILKPARVPELIAYAKSITRGKRRLLVSTSYGGRAVPSPEVVRESDYILLHGNGVNDPDFIADMVKRTRALPTYTTKPIVFNEDDHFDFEKPWNNYLAATSVYASWGYFDYRMKEEGFDEGYQSVPANWGISSARKRGFFNLTKEMTGQ